MRTADNGNQIAVPAVERALNILEYLGEKGAPATLKEISSTLGIPAASTFRIVRYLCSRGYIEEDANIQGRYELGLQLLRLAHLLDRRLDLRTIAVYPMRRLAEESGQTAQLGILQGYGVMYIDQAEPREPVSIIAALRTILPVNVSAAGKVLVAYLPPKEQEEFLERAELRAQTPKSITDKASFKAELERVREMGFAIDDEEYARGIGCLAVPIFDHTGTNVAAVGITGHIIDYRDKDRLGCLIQLVQEAAGEISAKMGYAGEVRA